MGLTVIVIGLPSPKHVTGLGKRCEQGFVQELVSEAAVERLDEGILHWLAVRRANDSLDHSPTRLTNVMPLNFGLIGSFQDGIAREFAAVLEEIDPLDRFLISRTR